jgi:enoyl-CoA hydratase/carnithine racemase
MNYETIEYQVKAQIATITLNRPAQLNAYSVSMQRELVNAFDVIDADDNVRAVIVTGAGKAFCAGLELSKGAAAFDPHTMEQDTPGQEPRFNPDGTPNYDAESNRDIGGLLTMRIFKCLKPVIAAVNGPAVGVGATMQLPMDIRLASESARFGFVFSKRGVVPEAMSSWFLPRIVSPSLALEWCFTGRLISAAEALQGGLVRSVHPPHELLAAAEALAHEIADHTAPVSVALTRQMMWRGLTEAHPLGAHRTESRLLIDRGMSRDTREGVASFLEKRAPQYPDQITTNMPASYPWWPPEVDEWQA